MRAVREDGPLATSYEMTVVADGREHHVTGVPVTNQLWISYACCPAAVAMVEWHTDDGRVGWGTAMEAFPIDRFAGGVLPARWAPRRACPPDPRGRGRLNAPQTRWSPIGGVRADPDDHRVCRGRGRASARRQGHPGSS